MELLLNLIWITLATGAFLIFLRSREHSAGGQISYHRALIALGCVALLLFPVVSASDDLHPSQAVLEDASRRIQHFVSPMQSSGPNPAVPMLFMLLVLSFLVASLAWEPRGSEPATLTLDGYLRLRAGRAPPSLCH